MIGISMKSDKETFSDGRFSDEREIKDLVLKELEKLRSDNEKLKDHLGKATNLLYELVSGVEKLNMCHSSDDYYVAVEVLISPELESWYNLHKKKFEEERLRLLKLNALSKLSDEEKQVLGLI